IERTPDLYLYKMQEQLRELCDIEVSLLTIWRALQRRGFNRKQVSRLSSFLPFTNTRWVSRVAAQRDENPRDNYQYHIFTTYCADQLVFVDEAACNCSTTKWGWAWAPCGEQA
ncbi:hypothetical protein DFH08DRAFT_679288, partial [Mycena albidolilacea]